MIKGDLSKLTPKQQMAYYRQVCDRHGLDWTSRPFDFLTLKARDGSQKMILYARKDATEQLRKINKIDLVKVGLTMDKDAGVVIVEVKAEMPDGRVDFGLGSASITRRVKEEYQDTNGKKAEWYVSEPLPGDEMANAIMRADTKAKRRATLSICGLGALDESELETMAKDIVAEPMATEAEVTKVANAITDAGADRDAHLRRLGIKSLKDMTSRQAEEVLELIKLNNTTLAV